MHCKPCKYVRADRGIKATEILLMRSNLRAGQFHAARRPAFWCQVSPLKGSKGRYRQLSCRQAGSQHGSRVKSTKDQSHTDGQGRGGSIRFIHGIHT